MRQARAAGDSAAAYRQRLMVRRTEILAGLSPRLDSASKMGLSAQEDLAQFSHEEFVIVRLNGLDYIQLRLIDEALDRIESGDYGICLNCERPIPLKRLDALPWARYCVACQDEVGAREEHAMLGVRPLLPLPR